MRAEIYYVIVAGLGGEPDYEQRFNAEAKDLDRIFKDSGSTARSFMLTGQDASSSHLKDGYCSSICQA